MASAGNHLLTKDINMHIICIFLHSHGIPQKRWTKPRYEPLNFLLKGLKPGP